MTNGQRRSFTRVFKLRVIERLEAEIPVTLHSTPKAVDGMTELH